MIVLWGCVTNPENYLKHKKFRSIYLFILLLIQALFSCGFAEGNSGKSVDISYRLRYENLHNKYKADSSGNDQIIVSQLLASFKVNREQLFGELEIEDSRSFLDDADTPIGTDDVNTMEPLQIWAGWQKQDEFSIKVGRITLDIGSRRLMARQRFRNSINAFDGVYSRYQQTDQNWQAFYLTPVTILPEDRNKLDNNDIEFDQQSNSRIWGIYLSNSNLDLYYFGMDEKIISTQLTTLGFRSWKTGFAVRWDYELEAAYQIGALGDLDVSAAMVHGHIGYQFANLYSSRVEWMIDYASGDDNPNDNESNRFNTLFGATRFDFGPTGIYGAFARTNIISPGVKWDFKPTKNQLALIAYRAVWLDSKKDSQSRSGVRDISGSSGRFVGNQLEARWKLNFPSHWQLELGCTYLLKGGFLQDAPNASVEGDTTYVYSQLVYQL